MHLSMASPGRPLPCFQCGSGSAKACQGCRLAYFCSRECQRQAWPEHKLACQKASPAPCMKLVDMGEGRGAGLRAVARIEMGAEVLREVPLLLAPNKIRHPFGRVLALYDLEPAARRRILLELVGPRIECGESSPSASEPPRPEREENPPSGEFAAVVAATKSSVAHWRDGAWFTRYPSDQAAATPPEQRLPPGISHSELLRYLRVFAINSWALPHRPDHDSESRVEYDRDLIDTDGGGGSALFRIGSKFNHDCSPNAAFHFEWLGDKGVGVFHALRTIEIGEEVTVSYLAADDLALGVLERRARLQRKPGMEHVTCTCPRCCVEAQVAQVMVPSSPNSTVGTGHEQSPANARASDLPEAKAAIQSTSEMDELD